MTRQSSLAVAVTALLLGAISAGRAQNPQHATSSSEPGRDFTSLARRIVTNPVGVKPGEIVVITGGQHTLPLMEALAIEAKMAGGRTALFFNTDRIERAFWTRTPEQHLGLIPPVLREWINSVNVYTGLPSVEDPAAIFDSLPPERIAIAQKAYADLPAALNASSIRGVFIGYPTRQAAERAKMDSAAYAAMHWNALAADYGQISRASREVVGLLASSKLVPGRTDFTFSVGGRKVFRTDGVISADDAKSREIMDRTENLPGGAVMVAPVETSANGRVAVARDLCRGQPMTGITFELMNGQVRNFKAAERAECFSAALAPYDGPKDRFGAISIGLNPALTMIDSNGAEYRPAAEGMVTIALGDNGMLGAGTQGTYEFPLPRATVTVDGKVIVRDGKLIRQAAGAATSMSAP